MGLYKIFVKIIFAWQFDLILKAGTPILKRKYLKRNDHKTILHPNIQKKADVDGLTQVSEKSGFLGLPPLYASDAGPLSPLSLFPTTLGVDKDKQRVSVRHWDDLWKERWEQEKVWNSS